MNESNTVKKIPTKMVKVKYRLTGCEIMHLREQGKLTYQRRGNAYYYSENDLERMFGHRVREQFELK